VGSTKTYSQTVSYRKLAGSGTEDFEAPIAVMSHGTAKEPIFNYANRTALNLFEMTC
jgi:hypothetical protein